MNTAVKVLQGVVKGCVEKLPNGKNYFRFSGIPYAKAPLNELRFKPPQKLLQFDKPEIDCTKEGNECFHKSMQTFEYVGSEDCLYLNVYVPESSRGNSKPKAVMVWIHGGAFSYGSSSREWYSPEYLLMEDVIVVTLNYRMHALGFLALSSMGISGNAGLKDQQLALEWVYENISNFNGDPKKICLFGESAGGVSVHLQILSPKSRRFISSAICQSGVAICDWAVQRDAELKSRTLATLLGCKTNDDRDVYDTLMKATPKELFDLGIKASTPDARRRNMSLVFTPSVERESSDAFMSKSPIELMKTEDIDIPIIFGTNDKDGMIQAAYLLKKIDRYNKDPVMFVPLSLNVDPSNSLAVEVGNQIKKFYFGDDDVSMRKIYEFIDLLTDLNFLNAQTICNELHAQYQHKSKQFLYEFRFDGELNLFKKLLMMEEYNGASHADDLFYLFGQSIFDTELEDDTPAAIMRKKMCKLWTNFAKYHNPTPEGENPLSIEWTPTTNVDENTNNINLYYLIIEEKFTMEKNVNKARMDFWRNIYKTWNAAFIKPKL